MSTAERIVNALLEADEVDPKAFTTRHSEQIYNVWEQVDGDMDWWEHGGTFHNPGLGQLVHIPGMEQEQADTKEWASWDIKLTPEDEAALLARLPVEIDPDFPDEGDQNEDSREEEREKLREQRAEQMNANRKMPIYRWLDDHIEDYSDHIDDVVRNGMPIEEFNELPLGAQWSVIGQIIGYHEFDDSPYLYTWAELDKYLQPREDFRGRSRQQHHLPEAP